MSVQTAVLDMENDEVDSIQARSDACKKLLKEVGREDGVIPDIDDVDDEVLLREYMGEPERKADK